MHPTGRQFYSRSGRGGKLKGKVWSSCTLIVLLVSFEILAANVASCQGIRPFTGDVEVQGKVLLRDGHVWVPHGFYQIAFEVAPGNLERADHPFWAIAYNHYTPQEYDDMQSAGADSVRLQISQIGADPQSPLFSREFLDKALSAIDAARARGLTVIVCVQDESHIPGDKSIDLPDAGTRRVWKEIAPRFASDRGVLFELLNEPRPTPNPQNWKRWEAAMNQAIQAVRETGAKNVIVADGLGVGQVLDGAPLLKDAQVAYSSHPYALQQYGQTRDAWDAKFGKFSRRAPVIITEWLSGGYFCDADTANSTVQFLQYLYQHGIGLEAGTWDWAPGGFGSARWGFPRNEISTFQGRECHQPGYGMGRTVAAWYTDGVPASAPK